jgi:AcrR family transcriptional regulator
MSTAPGSGGRRADAVRNRQLALDAAVALLSGPGPTLTVEAIAKRAGLGAGTVVRAFGGRDALVDAAISSLLGPVVDRARDLLARTSPEQALRVFLAELIAFQSAHHAISEQLHDLDMPATAALRAALVRAVEDMIAGARRNGTVRTDLEPAAIAAVIGESAFAIARASATSSDLATAYITVLMDGLRPQ